MKGERKKQMRESRIGSKKDYSFLSYVSGPTHLAFTKTFPHSFFWGFTPKGLFEGIFWGLFILLVFHREDQGRVPVSHSAYWRLFQAWPFSLADRRERIYRSESINRIITNFIRIAHFFKRKGNEGGGVQARRVKPLGCTSHFPLFPERHIIQLSDLSTRWQGSGLPWL